MVAVVTEVLKLDMSINLYMFHGGTNFGFMNGAAAVGVTLPKPMVTSYGMCNLFLTGIFVTLEQTKSPVPVRRNKNRIIKVDWSGMNFSLCC